MAVVDGPLVSVFTPVYNGEKHIAQCIRSVLAQRYTNFRYTIVNNCSTDGTRAIAQQFADQDPRIRIHDNREFLSVVDNHNHGFSLVCDEGKYIKVVGADDWLYPSCIAELVEVAEAHPTVGMVSSYVLLGTRVGFDGLPFPSTFVRGADMGRMYLRDQIRPFGGPSASLLRSRVVSEQQPFYKVGNYHGDTEAYLDLLREHDFGFVHQVLSFNRRGEDSRTTHFLQRVNSYAAAEVEDLIRYGPAYLSPADLEWRLEEATRELYGFLADSVLKRRGPDVWEYHSERMALLGTPIRYPKLTAYVLLAVADRLLNPKRTLEGVARLVTGRRRTLVSE